MALDARDGLTSGCNSTEGETPTMRLTAIAHHLMPFAALAGGIFVARRVLVRIDAMTGTAQRIMAGDLSERLPTGRSGDELDRLAVNLNAMLERIEALMNGLKEVSDNIAHDARSCAAQLCVTSPSLPLDCSRRL